MMLHFIFQKITRREYSVFKHNFNNLIFFTQ